MFPQPASYSSACRAAGRVAQIASCLAPLTLATAILRAQGHGPTQVQVAQVRSLEVSPTVRLVGTVRPRLRTLVAAEVDGLVEQLPIDDGDEVTQGQLLCKLRDTARRLALESAKARQEELAQVVEERQAELDKSSFEERRMTPLWEQGRSTEKEYQDAKADHRAAKGRAMQAEHALEAQRAAVEALADDLARMEIRAPCIGYVVKRLTEVGSWVDQGGPVVELVDLSSIRVRVDVPESMIDHCTVGQSAAVTVEALDRTYTGTIARTIPDADERARTFPLDVDVVNSGKELRSGMFVRAAIPSGPRGLRLVLPKDAVVVRGSGAMVFVVRETDEGPAAAPMEVKVVSELAGDFADHVAVEAKRLVAGDRVVVRGNEFMFGPGPVTVLPDRKPEPSASQTEDPSRPAADSGGKG